MIGSFWTGRRSVAGDSERELLSLLMRTQSVQEKKHKIALVVKMLITSYTWSLRFSSGSASVSNVSQNLQSTAEQSGRGEGESGGGKPSRNHTRLEERDKELASWSELTLSKQLVELPVLSWSHVTVT